MALIFTYISSIMISCGGVQNFFDKTLYLYLWPIFRSKKGPKMSFSTFFVCKIWPLPEAHETFSVGFLGKMSLIPPLNPFGCLYNNFQPPRGPLWPFSEGGPQMPPPTLKIK